jgi:hypothetical protein
MNSIIDLDIKNYTPNDLITFFKLSPNNCSYNDVTTSADIMINNLLDSNTMTPENTNSILVFIRKAKNILKYSMIKNNNIENDDIENDEDHYNSKNVDSYNINNSSNNITNNTNNILSKQIKETNAGIINPYNNVGKILNPNSTSHQSLQKASIPSNSVNPYTGSTIVANYIFNTQFRDNFFFTQSENCTFTLPVKIKNVIAISLSAVQIPNVILPFFYNGTNSIYIYEEVTNIQGLVSIEPGYYTINTFPSILENAINQQLLGSTPNRFKVAINPYNYFTTISNTTYNFRMNLLRDKPSYLDNPCSEYEYYDNANIDDTVTKNNINTEASKFVTTMGYLIGYRNIEYVNSNSYTSESMFNNTTTDYIYFCMNEYSTGSQYIANYGVLPEAVINDNILALVPITSPKFTSTFDDNSDFIYKTRNYNGPIDIQKISIKILNAQGQLVYLHNFDYSFNLQITTIYDNLSPFQPQFTT